MITPPPSPHFDAKTACAQLRSQEGYVSFADVQGLGEPLRIDDVDEDEEGRHLLDGAGKRWWGLLWKN